MTRLKIQIYNNAFHYVIIPNTDYVIIPNTDVVVFTIRNKIVMEIQFNNLRSNDVKYKCIYALEEQLNKYG